MLDEILKLFRNSPRWANSPIARRLGFSGDLSYEEDELGEFTRCRLRMLACPSAMMADAAGVL